MSRAPGMDKKSVDDRLLDLCLARAIATGDIVNFRFLFVPYSPFREDSCEEIDTPKYAYLIPENESDPELQQALALVRRSDIAAHIRAQLQKEGPPQLPWEPVMTLADNAARLGKYTSAAQAYELLRIRRRMQEEFLSAADSALDRGDIPAAATGYHIAMGLDYDYAAFPEPLPAVPNYQERALVLHGVYPALPDGALGMQPDDIHLGVALPYLLGNPELPPRLAPRAPEIKAEFAAALARCLDPGWETFVPGYRVALAAVEEHAELLTRLRRYSPDALDLAFEELLDDDRLQALRAIPSVMLGHDRTGWEWWQWMKELCYRHPAAALFVTRQTLHSKEEIVIPCCRPDNLLARALGLSG